jgi:hypothetical protein
MTMDERPNPSGESRGTLETIREAAPWWRAAVAIAVAVVGCTGMFGAGWFLGRDAMRPDVVPRPGRDAPGRDRCLLPRHHHHDDGHAVSLATSINLSSDVLIVWWITPCGSPRRMDCGHLVAAGRLMAWTAGGRTRCDACRKAGRG